MRYCVVMNLPERSTISRDRILAHISLIVPNCLVGANDDVAIPIGMLKIDLKAEIALVSRAAGALPGSAGSAAAIAS